MTSYFFNYFENANLIIPSNKLSGQLWLGNYKAALDPQFLKDQNITVIVNVSPDIPYIYNIMDQKDHKLMKLETFRIPVYDSLLDQDIYLMEQYFNTVLPFLLKKLLTEKKNVLVHCAAGRQRSFAVVAALLFVFIDNNLLNVSDIKNKDDKSKLMKKVIAYISKKRPQVCSFGLRCNFKSSLERFFHIKF